MEEEEVITGTGKRPLKSLAEMLKERSSLDRTYLEKLIILGQ